MPVLYCFDNSIFVESVKIGKCEYPNFVFFCFVIYVFIYFWLCWIFVAVRRPSLVAVSGDFSCCGARALGTQASVSCGSQALECRLSSCGARA